MSTSTLYFENGVASVSIDRDACVHLTYYTGKHMAEDLLEVLQHTGYLLQRRQWHWLLEDQRRLTPLTTEQQLVVARYWQGQARHLSQPLCVAVVQAQNVFARLTAAALRHSLQAAPITYSLFADMEAASTWLRTQASSSQFSL
jgi:hypothetical protein